MVQDVYVESSSDDDNENSLFGKNLLAHLNDPNA